MARTILASVDRMSGLIDDVMDFARGRLGGGLTLDRSTDEPPRTDAAPGGRRSPSQQAKPDH